MTVEYGKLRVLFDALEVSETGLSVAYASVALEERKFLAKSSAGKPALLLRSLEYFESPSLHLGGMRVRHNVGLRLEPNGEEDEFSVVECTSADASLIDWFLRFTPEFIEVLGRNWQASEINREVTRLSEFFRRLSSNSQRDLTGLWAELLLLVCAEDAVTAVTAWHVAASQSKDFTLEGDHFELKATVNGSRVHRFAADQLSPSSRVLVGSVLLSASDAGPSLLDLFSKVRARLVRNSTEDIKVVDQVLALVGNRVAEAETTRFDDTAARQGFKLSLASDVPQIVGPFPAGVSRVEFWSNLDACPEAPPDVIRSSRLWRTLASVCC